MTNLYDRDAVTIRRPIAYERDYLMSERFYPGEFGLVALFAVASLLLYALGIWGITNDVKVGGLVLPSYSSLDNGMMPYNTAPAPNGTTTRSLLGATRQVRQGRGTNSNASFFALLFSFLC